MSYTKTSKRTQTFSGQTATTVSYAGGSYAGPSGSIGQTFDMPDYKAGEAMVDWRKKVKLAADATTYYQRDSYKVTGNQPCFATLVRGSDLDFPWWAKETISGQGFPYPSNLVSLTHMATNLAEVDSAALALLYKKIRSESSQMNGLQFLGELREALHMIRKPAESIWKGLQTYITLLGKRKKGIRKGIPLDKKIDIWKGIVAGTWLEVSFGWKPFVSDTQDIAKTLGRFCYPDIARTRVRAYKEDILDSEAHVVLTTFCGHTSLSVSVEIRTDTTGSVQYICGLRGNGSGPAGSVESLRNLSGLTLENFVPTIWELTPYSFLVDYFTNVGDILNSAFTNTVGVTWHMKTQRLVTTRTSLQNPCFVNVAPWVVLNFSGVPGSSQVVKSTMERIPLVGPLGIPDLVFSLPGKITKYLNITALLAGAHHSRFKF